jgi:multidrug efflux pump
LFSEFALALAGAVLVSGLVALTLSPMMSSLLLRHNPNPNRFDRFMEKLLTGISTGYEKLLVKVLRHFRWLVIAIMLACGVGIAVVYPTMKQELRQMARPWTTPTNMRSSSKKLAALIQSLIVFSPI